MAQTETRFATRSEFRAINDNLTILHTSFDTKLANVNGTLSGRLGELNNELGIVKRDIRYLKAEVSQVKAEVSQVKAEVSQVKAEVSQVKGRLSNGSRNMPWDTLTIIGVPNDANEVTVPEIFPSTVRAFWKLQFPSHSMEPFHFIGYLLNLHDSIGNVFISLLIFYDVQGFQYWDQALPDYTLNDEVDTATSLNDYTVDPPQHLLSLEEAVEKYPALALESLAKSLGLPFAEIRSFFEKSKQLQQKEKSPPTKRPSDITKTEMVAAKRSRNQKSHSPPERDIFFRHISTPVSSSSSEKTKLVWDAESNQKARDNMIAIHGHKPRSTESSTAAFDSQERQKIRDGIEKSANKR